MFCIIFIGSSKNVDNIKKLIASIYVDWNKHIVPLSIYHRFLVKEIRFQNEAINTSTNLKV